MYRQNVWFKIHLFTKLNEKAILCHWYSGILISRGYTFVARSLQQVNDRFWVWSRAIRIEPKARSLSLIHKCPFINACIQFVFKREQMCFCLLIKSNRNGQIRWISETLSKCMYMNQARDAKQSSSLWLVQIRVARCTKQLANCWHVRADLILISHVC